MPDQPYLDFFCAIVEQAYHKALKSTKPLSPEMTQLLGLVIFADYELFPATGPKRRDDLPGPKADRDL